MIDDNTKNSLDESIKNPAISAEEVGEPGSVAGEGFVLGDSGPVRSGKDRSPPLPPVDFSSFVLGLGQMALIHLDSLP